MARRRGNYDRRKTRIGLDKLNDAVSIALSEYGLQVEDAIGEALGELAREAVGVLRQSGKYKDRTGNYRKSFMFQRDGPHQLGTPDSYTVFSDAPEYRLTHLLENGHLTRDGTTRTEAYPHWQDADEYLAAQFEQRLAAKLNAIE